MLTREFQASLAEIAVMAEAKPVQGLLACGLGNSEGSLCYASNIMEISMLPFSFGRSIEKSSVGLAVCLNEMFTCTLRRFPHNLTTIAEK